MDIKTLPQQEPRIESGPIQFGDDWPGVFLRGDNAAFYAFTLRGIIERLERGEPADATSLLVLRGIQDIFASSDLTGLSKMKPESDSKNLPSDVKNPASAGFKCDS